MSKKTPVTLPQAIQDLVEKIETTAEKSDDHTIEAAEQLRELRRLIEAGAVGEVNWYAWVEENVNLRKSRLYVLMRIAEAPDSRAEAVRQREMNARRQSDSSNHPQAVESIDISLDRAPAATSVGSVTELPARGPARLNRTPGRPFPN